VSRWRELVACILLLVSVLASSLALAGGYSSTNLIDPYANISSSYSLYLNQFNYLIGNLTPSYSYSMRQFNYSSVSVAPSYSYLEKTFDVISNASMYPSTQALMELSCRVVDLVNGSPVLYPELSNSTWPVPDLNYSLPILFAMWRNCSNCVVRIGIGEPYASWIASNGTVQLFLDGTNVTSVANVTLVGSRLLIYLPMNSTCILSDPLTCYHYLYIYYGVTNASNVERLGLPVLINATLAFSGTPFKAAVPVVIPNICQLANCSDLYVVNASGYPVKFWIMNVSSTSVYLVLWLNITAPTEVVYVNSSVPNPYASYNTTSFLTMVDTFEEGLKDWYTYGSGVLSVDNTTAFQGRYSLLKSQYPDPNGGYKAILQGSSVTGCVALYAWINRTVFSGSNQDRLGFVDGVGNGYGIAVDLSTTRIAIDIRKSWSATQVAIKTVSALSQFVGRWYLAKLEVCYYPSYDIYAEVFNANNTELVAATFYHDSSATANYAADVYVLGGYPYHVDAMMVIQQPPQALNVTWSQYGVDPDLVDPCNVYVYVPPPPPTTTTVPTITVPSVNVSVPTVAVPSARMFTPVPPGLATAGAMLTFALFAAVFIAFARYFPWYVALAVASTILVVMSLIMFQSAEYRSATLTVGLIGIVIGVAMLWRRGGS